MKSENKLLLLLLTLFPVLMSIPFLVPHLGALSLVALVPLLCAERVACQTGKKRFFLWYFCSFLAWNLMTTWWVCKATVGGGIAASVINAAMMSLIFLLFVLSKKKLQGVLPYILLVAMWIAWERWYMVHAEISWPWLTLGNAFAGTTRLIQWYDLTGVLGGSLWIWAVNLGIFAFMVVLSDGRWNMVWNPKQRSAFAIALFLLLLAPVVISVRKYNSYVEKDECGQMDVCLAQSNFDPWHKLRSVPQREQNAQAVGLFEKALEDYDSKPVLLILPETFCHDIWLNDPSDSPTWDTFTNMLSLYENANLLFGASTAEAFYQRSSPHILARQVGKDFWYESRNTAFMVYDRDNYELCHKNKLVVGSEKTPFPKIFVPIDNALGGVMGRSIAPGDVGLLHFKGGEGNVPLGVPICYESVYSEYCTKYVAKGAQALCVITNDGWWGTTPGYRQHFSYSRLRAIETRRDIARCANTGISAIIDQKGDVLQQTKWWTADYLKGSVNLTEYKTPFVKYGDIIGRISTFVCVLLLLAWAVRLIQRKNSDE